ncbi:hypothetical protein OUZ56_000677 [Daphnia magna]|uniref:Uncharacterized protein n=1 Tax=Daphnia magna TaxID=35525 RepID=A0ABR0A0E4_9CRUS|nr:hypothetical protein OUZ56_000677 [Daphnia magna]
MAALELGSGCMCDLMWRCMWQAPLVMTGHLMMLVNSGSAWVPQEGIAEHSHRAKTAVAICYVQTWNESHVTKSTKCGNNIKSAMELFSGQLEGFLLFTELYHFHGILNCLSADCHLASFEWYDPYQQCYDALLKYTNPSENILIEIMEISALHAELHNDGFIGQRYINIDYTLSGGDMVSY